MDFPLLREELTVLNPYKRLRELTTTSQKDFAAKYKFSKTAMIYVESGQFPDISEYMIESLARELEDKGINGKETLKEEYGQANLQDAYHQWQSTERMQNAHLFYGVRPTEGSLMPSLSPFHVFVKNTTGTLQGFCKALKVPSSTVKRYEVGATKSMPLILNQALSEVRYPYINQLEDLQRTWANK